MKKNIKYAYADGNISFNTESLIKIEEQIDNIVSRVKAESEQGMADETASFNQLISLPEDEAIDKIESYLSQVISKSSSYRNLMEKFGADEQAPPFGAVKMTWIKAKALHKFFISNESLSKKVVMWSILKATNLPILFNIPLVAAALMDFKNQGIFSSRGVKSLFLAAFHGGILAEEWATTLPTLIPVFGGFIGGALTEFSQAMANIPKHASWASSVFGITSAWDGMEDFKECIEGKVKDKSFVERKLQNIFLGGVTYAADWGGAAIRGTAGTAGGPVGLVGEIAAQIVEGVPNMYMLWCLWNKWVSKYEDEVMSEYSNQIPMRPFTPDFSREIEGTKNNERIILTIDPDKNRKLSFKHIKEIVKLANTLDEKGLFKEADALDILVYELL